MSLYVSLHEGTVDLIQISCLVTGYENFKQTAKYTQNFALLHCCICSIQVFVDEIADPKYRGFMVCSMSTSASFGIMLISSLGAFVDWRMASALAVLPSVINIITLYFVQESPTWFVRRNRMAEAEKALLWIWGPGNAEQVSVCRYKDGVMNCKFSVTLGSELGRTSQCLLLHGRSNNLLGILSGSGDWAVKTIECLWLYGLGNELQVVLSGSDEHELKNK